VGIDFLSERLDLDSFSIRQLCPNEDCELDGNPLASTLILRLGFTHELRPHESGTCYGLQPILRFSTVSRARIPRNRQTKKIELEKGETTG